MVGRGLGSLGERGEWREKIHGSRHRNMQLGLCILVNRKPINSFNNLNPLIRQTFRKCRNVGRLLPEIARLPEHLK